MHDITKIANRFTLQELYEHWPDSLKIEETPRLLDTIFVDYYNTVDDANKKQILKAIGREHIANWLMGNKDANNK